MKRTRLRIRWADTFALLAFCALLLGFLTYAWHQVPDSPLSGVTAPVEGQR